MADQLDLFAARPTLPEGFKYQREIITADRERELLAQIRELPFTEFDFHGFLGKRRTVSFGWAYNFSRARLEPAGGMPDFLASLRETAAAFAGSRAEQFEQVLVIEYGENAGIGWHRDKGVFGDVIGISLLAPCRFRLRRRAGEKWQRVALEAEPRSAYLLSGPARTEWEHSIPPVEALRYSVTYRSRREAVKP